MHFVLVHGAYHGSWCWDQLRAELERGGHTSTAVDLPCDDPDAGAERYVDEVIHAIPKHANAVVLVGHDGHRGWVYYVTVDPVHRHQGYGREIMTSAENWLRARGIEKLQLMVRGDNAKVHAFYRSIGYYDQERVVFAKWLDGREPTP